MRPGLFAKIAGVIDGQRPSGTELPRSPSQLGGGYAPIEDRVEEARKTYRDQGAPYVSAIAKTVPQTLAHAEKWLGRQLSPSTNTFEKDWGDFAERGARSFLPAAASVAPYAATAPLGFVGGVVAPTVFDIAYAPGQKVRDYITRNYPSKADIKRQSDATTPSTFADEYPMGPRMKARLSLSPTDPANLRRLQSAGNEEAVKNIVSDFVDTARMQGQFRSVPGVENNWKDTSKNWLDLINYGDALAPNRKNRIGPRVTWDQGPLASIPMDRGAPIKETGPAWERGKR